MMLAFIDSICVTIPCVSLARGPALPCVVAASRR
jgi:hypothetical protein